MSDIGILIDGPADGQVIDNIDGDTFGVVSFDVEALLKNSYRRSVEGELDADGRVIFNYTKTTKIND